VSKESIIKKRLEKEEKQNKPIPGAPAAKEPTVGPIMSPLIQRPRRRLNRKFIFTFAIWIVALIAAIYFLTKM
jgi:hypothetical protein